MQQNKKIGKFAVDRVIGRGASGTVYKAYDALMRRDVAIKLLNPASDVSPDEEDVANKKRFLCEARAYGRLRHPNIVTCYACEETGDQLLLVMEYVNGVTLKDVFDQNQFMSLQRATSIVLQILDALAYAHSKGVIHRDIKPSNIMLDEQGDVKITDFGIARLDATDLTRTGMVLGSPGYMSPEQFMGRKIDERTDLFSVAVIFYRLISGRVPFHGDDLGEILHNVLYEEPQSPKEILTSCPPHISDAIMQGLAKVPTDRFSSAQAFIDALENVAEKERAVETGQDDGELTLLDAQGVTALSVAMPKQPWYASTSMSILFVGLAVATFMFTYFSSPSETPHSFYTQAEINDIEVVEESTPNAQDVINALVNAQQCLYADVTYHELEKGLQVDMNGVYADEKALNHLTSKIARMPEVMAVNKKLSPASKVFCDVQLMLGELATRASFFDSSPVAKLATFTGGEYLKFSFNTLDRPLYYYTDYFMKDGSVVRLSPLQTDVQNYFSTAEQVEIGSPKDELQWEIAAPYGVEMISIIASESPIVLPTIPIGISSSEYLHQLKQYVGMKSAVQVYWDFMFIRTQAD